MKVLAISGSLRSSSSTGALLRAAAQLGAPDMTFDLYESVGALPHFSPDLDVEPLPEPVAELRARIARSDALLIVSRLRRCQPDRRRHTRTRWRLRLQPQ